MVARSLASRANEMILLAGTEEYTTGTHFQTTTALFLAQFVATCNIDIIGLRIMSQQYPSFELIVLFCSRFCSHVGSDPRVRNGGIVMGILMLLLHGSK